MISFNNYILSKSVYKLLIRTVSVSSMYYKHLLCFKFSDNSRENVLLWK